MPSNKDQNSPTADDGSGQTSPTETGTPSRRFEPILKDEEEEVESPRPIGTIRRNRPPAITTDSAAQSSIDSTYDTAEETTSEGQRTPTQDASRPRGANPASSNRQQMLSPETMHSASKPKLGRRASSKQALHRGHGFSVDDDPEEYESDVARRRASKASGYGHTLQRQPSTLRRRPTAPPSSLPQIDSRDEDDEEVEERQTPASVRENVEDDNDESSETAHADGEDDDDDDDDLSDAESFTLKDKQNAINETHPFGIRIWKPALYKKNRSVEKTAEGDIHSSPGANVSRWLAIFNILWTILFGWWLALAAGLSALVCYIFAFAPEATLYGRILLGLSGYLFYPFGKFVKLEQDEAYADEDEGEGRSISEYEQWQQGDLEDGRLFFGPLTSRSIIGRRRSVDSDETASLLGRTRRGIAETERRENRRARLFGRGQWTIGRVIFFMFFYSLIAPLMLLASLVCYFLVFWIPMARTTVLLFYHLRRHPLALSFHSDTSYSRDLSFGPSSILLCTYRAVGLKYWKYTIDGTNIFLINLIGVVLFAIFDYWVLDVALGLDAWITNPGFVFALALFSIIPLAYFIGQAVASISAQSSMGVGAAINAFFSTIVEVFLYCVALSQGKGKLVEGSIIGSIFAGILFLPGLSMCFGAIKRKTQRFNVRSAGVTSTMLLFATIAAFGPTLFYQIYGSHELNCHSCDFLGGHPDGPDEDCRRCYFSQTPAITDDFFLRAVRPYCWFSAVLLFLSYIIGLWFTLRTHAAVIWNAEVEEKKAHQAPNANGSINHPSMHGSTTLPPKAQGSGSSKDTAHRNSSNTIRDTQLYKRILSQSLKQDGLRIRNLDDSRQTSTSSRAPLGQSPHLVPPKSADGEGTVLTDNSSQRSVKVAGLSEEESSNLVHQVAEMAATAAAVAARDATRPLRERKSSIHHTPRALHSGNFAEDHEAAAAGEAPGGHDAPNWGRMKSAIILLGATLLYAIIAEILVNTVDVVLESVDIDEKFLGITLFALVPNTTEFLNAISFAMNGNIALSMEIGSAYALQVCLLQIPALVLFSAIHGRYIDPTNLFDHTFSLIFPQWDMVTVILCVFLLSYVYGEGKSNYFKGSILVLTYAVIVVGFYLAGFQMDGDVDVEAARRFGSKSFSTIGRSGSGRAW
ncbi:MAG: hypothetical protein Q9164_001829 [Protoblastenia rupestris]